LLLILVLGLILSETTSLCTFLILQSLSLAMPPAVRSCALLLQQLLGRRWERFVQGRRHIYMLLRCGVSGLTESEVLTIQRRCIEGSSAVYGCFLSLYIPDAFVYFRAMPRLSVPLQYRGHAPCLDSLLRSSRSQASWLALHADRWVSGSGRSLQCGGGPVNPHGQACCSTLELHYRYSTSTSRAHRQDGIEEEGHGPRL
jgi:hypothetical protein